MTTRRVLAVWILAVFTFLFALGTVHAFVVWQLDGSGTVTLLGLWSSGLQVDVTTYFIGAFALTSLFFGLICNAVLKRESLERPLLKLRKHFEDRLNEKTRELQDSTNEALAKLGLRDFQLKESVEKLQTGLSTLDSRVKTSVDTNRKAIETSRARLNEIKGTLERIENAKKDLPKSKRKSKDMDSIRKEMVKMQKALERMKSDPSPYLSSTDDVRALEGKILKKATVKRLRERGVETVEDLLLKSPEEIALTKAMLADEARSLQSIVQLLTVPGMQHEEAVLLLKSGVTSTQELALQESLSLFARVSKVAEPFIESGKMRDNEKPTLERITTWIKWARA